MKFGIFLILVLIGFAGCSGTVRNVHTLKMLASLGENDKLKERALEQETANFRRLKERIENDTIKEGISAKSAIRKFGEPVLVLSRSDGEKWAYKPSQASWVGGEKIYLFFDKQGTLIDWEYVEQLRREDIDVMSNAE